MDQTHQTDGSKTARIDARLPESVLATIRRAAELQGRSMSDFVVNSAREAAERAIQQNDLIELSAVDQHRFAEALLNPAPLSESLKRAAARHHDLVEPS